MLAQGKGGKQDRQSVTLTPGRRLAFIRVIRVIRVVVNLLNPINHPGGMIHGHVFQSETHVNLTAAVGKVHSIEERVPGAPVTPAGTNATGSRWSSSRNNSWGRDVSDSLRVGGWDRDSRSGILRGGWGRDLSRNLSDSLRVGWGRDLSRNLSDSLRIGWGGWSDSLSDSQSGILRGGWGRDLSDSWSGILRSRDLSNRGSWGDNRGRGLACKDSNSDGGSWNSSVVDWVALRRWQTGGDSSCNQACRDLRPAHGVEVSDVGVAAFGCLQLLAVLDAGKFTLVLGILAVQLGLEASGCVDVTDLTVGFTLRLVLGGLTRSSFNRGLLAAQEKHLHDFQASCARQQQHAEPHKKRKSAQRGQGGAVGLEN